MNQLKLGQQYLMFKESEVPKYLDLLTNINTNRQKINYLQNKRQRYSQKQQNTLNNIFRNQSEEQLIHAPVLPKKCARKRQRSQNQNIGSCSDGDIKIKSQQRRNLYQIYCQSLEKKKNQDCKRSQYEKKSRNLSFNEIFQKIDEKIIHIYKSKSLRVSHELPNKIRKNSHKKHPQKAQPSQLNIGSINTLKMPKIQQKTSNLSIFRNYIKQDRVSLKFKEIIKEGERLAPKLEGWETRYDDQSLAPIYFHS